MSKGPSIIVQFIRAWQFWVFIVGVIVVIFCRHDSSSKAKRQLEQLKVEAQINSVQTEEDARERSKYAYIELLSERQLEALRLELTQLRSEQARAEAEVIKACQTISLIQKLEQLERAEGQAESSQGGRESAQMKSPAGQADNAESSTATQSPSTSLVDEICEPFADEEDEQGEEQ